MSVLAPISAVPPPRLGRVALAIDDALRAVAGRVRMRHLATLGCAAAAVVPVAIFGAWVEHAVLEREVAAAREKQMLVARAVTQTLERHVVDVEAAIDAAVASRSASGAFESAFAALGIKQVCLLDAAWRPQRSIGSQPCGAAAILPRELLAGLARQASGQAGRSAFTGAVADRDGSPTIYAVRAIDGGFALAALGTDPLAQLQSSLAFGERGHAAIVDRNGRVLAHPIEAWREEMKDLSRLHPVREMMAGRAGATTFYSPAMKAELLSAYAAAAGSGFGVMVSQPMAELAARAGDVRTAMLIVLIIAVLLAATIAQLLTRALARPLGAVTRAATLLADGVAGARVGALPATAPRELRELGRAFDAMAETVGRQAADLADAARRAEQANRAKSEFLANMSHEFRTPLNAVIGFSEIMRDRVYGPVANERYQAYVTDIHASAAHLLTMVNGILDLAKAEAGRLEIERGAVDLAEVVEQAVRMVRPRADAKSIQVAVDVAAGIVVDSDELKLRQVLLNLLSNAVKFTPEGGAVGVEATVDEDGVRLRVVDTGIGIAAADLPQVFEPFFQVERAFDRRHEGTGLGLPLARKLVECLGGTLTLASAPGAGTTAEILLPCRDIVPAFKAAA